MVSTVLRRFVAYSSSEAATTARSRTKQVAAFRSVAFWLAATATGTVTPPAVTTTSAAAAAAAAAFVPTPTPSKTNNSDDDDDKNGLTVGSGSRRTTKQRFSSRSSSGSSSTSSSSSSDTAPGVADSSVPSFALASTSSSSSSSSRENTVCRTASMIPEIDSDCVIQIQNVGGTVVPLDPMGAAVYGIDLTAKKPPDPSVLKAFERIMAERGFVVFKDQKQDMTVQEELMAACWWGSQELHSTHGVHPATPDNNEHIFRLSNDPAHGILGVGPQWHNDGSFVPNTFSHVGYRIVRPPRRGGTQFAHQGAAFDALPPPRREFWDRLVSVNSNSGVLHPAVHVHPITQRKSVWLHLGMTGAVIEKIDARTGTETDTEPTSGDANHQNNNNSKKNSKYPGYRLLNPFEMKTLFHEYNDLLNAGLTNGYGYAYEYEAGDFLFIDNLAVAHRASPHAHLPPTVEGVGLRILHRTTVRAAHDLTPQQPNDPRFRDLPPVLDVYRPSPFGSDGGGDDDDENNAGGGVWIGGGIGFRWDDTIRMQN